MTFTAQGLAPITNPLNSVLVEKKLINVDQKFIQLVSLAEGLPRTEVLESGKNEYSHGLKKAFRSFSKFSFSSHQYVIHI